MKKIILSVITGLCLIFGSVSQIAATPADIFFGVMIGIASSIHQNQAYKAYENYKCNLEWEQREAEAYACQAANFFQYRPLYSTDRGLVDAVQAKITNERGKLEIKIVRIAPTWVVIPVSDPVFIPAVKPRISRERHESEDGVVEWRDASEGINAYADRLRMQVGRLLAKYHARYIASDLSNNNEDRDPSEYYEAINQVAINQAIVNQAVIDQDDFDAVVAQVAIDDEANA